MDNVSGNLDKTLLDSHWSNSKDKLDDQLLISRIIKLVRENGKRSASEDGKSPIVRLRLLKLNDLWRSIFNSLLWGDNESEKDLADKLNSKEFDKCWHISKSRNRDELDREAEYIYFITVLEDNDLSAACKRSTLSPAAHRLLRNSLPSPNRSPTDLPCNRLPVDHCDLIARRRSLPVADVSGLEYSRELLGSLSHVSTPNAMVLEVWEKFPRLQRSKDRKASLVRDLPRIKPDGYQSGSSHYSGSPISIASLQPPLLHSPSQSPAQAKVDMDWFFTAPRLVNTTQSTFIVGTPMYIFAPKLMLFSLAQGNLDAERISAVNEVLVKYFDGREWVSMDAKLGVPCVARSEDEDGNYTYVRAIIVDWDEKEMNFKCVCMDFSTIVPVEPSDITALPECFSAQKLTPTLFIAEMRNVEHLVDVTAFNSLIYGYIDRESQTGTPLPALMVPSSSDNRCAVDWVDPETGRWMSYMICKRTIARQISCPVRLPTSGACVIEFEKLMSDGSLDFSGLQFAEDQRRDTVEKAVEAQVNDIEASTVSSYLDSNEPIEFDFDPACGDVGNPMTPSAQSPSPSYTSKLPERNGNHSQDWSTLFRDVFRQTFEPEADNHVRDAFVAHALLFAEIAKMMDGSSSWDNVISEIKDLL